MLKYEMKILFLFLVIIVGITSQKNGRDTKAINIEVLLKSNSNHKILLPIRSAIADNNYFYDNNNIVNVSIQEIDDDNLFSSTKKFCNSIRNKNFATVINLDATSATPMQSICSKLNLAYLQIHWNEETEYLHNSTSLNFYPDPETITFAISTIAESLNWQSFFLLYEKPSDLHFFRRVLGSKPYYEQNLKNFIIVRQLNSGYDQRSVLKELKKIGSFPIILHCNPEKITNFFQQIRGMGLDHFFNTFFLTSFDAHTVKFDFDEHVNITSMKLFDPKSSEIPGLLRAWEAVEFRSGNSITMMPSDITTGMMLGNEAMKSLIAALNHFNVKEIKSMKSLDCNDLKQQNPFGRQILSLIKSHSQFEFNADGNRTNTTIYVIDGLHDDVVGIWNAKDPITLNLLRTEEEQQKAFMRGLSNSTIMVSSILLEPYMMLKPPSENGEVYEGKHRYHGYSVDLMQAIADIVGFDFDIVITESNQNGFFEATNETWIGVMGDVISRRAILGVGDITITPKREEYVDFSLPFMNLGLDVIYKKVEKEKKLFDFLAPLSVELWLFIFTLLMFTSVILYLVSRMAPGDWENPNPNDDDPEELENPWTMKNCLWLTLASIMNVGSDILPKGISSRLVASMWWLFALIITNTYTASMAAYLTSGAPLEIKHLESLATQSKITYGMVKKGSTEEFFKNSNYSTYIRMYSNMKLSEPSVFENGNKEGIRRVQTTPDGLYAFLMETTTLEYEIESNCDLQSPRKPIYPRNYGIIMPLNYPYRTNINSAILDLQEKGNLTDLKIKWWQFNKKQCEEIVQEPALTLQEVRGVFLVLGVGLVFSFFFGIMEFLYNCYNIAIEEHESYGTVVKKGLKFAVNVFVTEKRC